MSELRPVSDLLWRADAHGSLLLHPFDQEGFVFVQARRSYCDRGHWEWGCQGIHGDHSEAPSYYFMRADTARAEVEAWVARQAGRTLPVAPADQVFAQGAFAHPSAADHGWAWESPVSGTWTATLTPPGQIVPLVLTLTEESGAQGPYWLLHARGVPNLDDSDRFPRRYLDPAHARQEAEEFLVWRLLTQPIEHPGPFQPDQSWPAVHLAPAPRAPRPR